MASRPRRSKPTRASSKSKSKAKPKAKSKAKSRSGSTRKQKLAKRRSAPGPKPVGEGIEFHPAARFAGTVRAAAPRRRAVRAGAKAAASSLDAAIAETGARIAGTLTIGGPSGSGGTKRRAARAPKRAARAPLHAGDLEIETGPDEAAVVLRENPDGTTSWLYPEPAPEGGGRRRARAAAPAPHAAPATQARRRWVCRVTVHAAPVSAPSRGPKKRRLFGAIAAAVVKVIVFKVIGWAAGELLQHLVKRHETKRMKEGFKKVTADGFAPPDTPPMAEGDWPDLSGKRALVFVHGTFSDALGAFRLLDRATLQALIARYPGGVYAFDHFTLSKSPLENAQLFYEQIPIGQGDLQFDLVSHSRGGLVARSLTEMNQQPQVTFGNVVFFGTPNAGTPLADPARLKQCLDVVTNLTKLLPPFAGLFVISWIVAVVQWVAANGVGKLPGLVPQDPHSDFLKALNDPATVPQGRYAAVTANYEADSGLLAKLRDKGMDALFAADNDLVVPTASVTTVDAASPNPALLADRVFHFQGGRVFHGNFFEQPESRAFLLTVLR